MPETSMHPDNATPIASDQDVKRMDKDTPFHPGSTATPLTPRPAEQTSS
jgi:hypothetical protein